MNGGARRGFRPAALAAVSIVMVGASACGPAPAPPALPLSAEDFTPAGVPSGIDSAEVRLSFGEPDSVVVSPSPFGDDADMTTWVYPGFEIRFAGAVGPVGYMMRAPGERTVRGLAVGDPVGLVLRRYGDPDARIDQSWSYILEEPAGVLNVVDFVVSEDTVRRIYLGRAVP